MTDSKNLEAVSGSVMDGVAEKGGVESPTKKCPVEYKVYPIRWLVLFIFVLYSASNSMQWIQYTIIQDAIVKYYGVSSITVYWTSMIYMISYIPLIFPGSYLLDKTVSTSLNCQSLISGLVVIAKLCRESAWVIFCVYY